MHKPTPYFVYLILSVASTLFNAMMFTYLTVYYVQTARMNPLELVLVGTVLEMTAFGFEVPTGVVADAYSRRIAVVFGTFITGAAFIQADSIGQFVGGPAIGAIGTFYSLRAAMVAAGASCGS